MPLPDAFKFDQRVRTRYLRKGQLSESDLEKHLSALKDVAGNSATVELKQPAFQTDAERAQNTIVVRPAPVRAVLPVPVSVDELDDEIEDEIEDEEDDELEDDEDEETTVVQTAKGEAARAAPKSAPKAAVPEAEEPAPGSGPRGSVEGAPKGETEDDGWG